MAADKGMETRPTLIAYTFVGGVGFLVDASLLTVMVTSFSADLFPARCVSFSAATIVTWLLNRIAVFPRTRQSHAGPVQEYGRYLLVQISGALTNLTVFFLLIDLWPSLGRMPPLPLAVGAAASLAVTYGGARRFVFT